LGIGTTLPAATATIAKDLNGPLDATAFRLNSSSTNDSNTLFGGPVSSGNYSFFQSYKEGTSAGVRALALNPSGGSVGIGTSSPSSYSSAANNLVVQDTAGEGGITIVSTNTGSSNIFFADTDAAVQGQIKYQHSGDYMRFYTAASERMRIASDGSCRWTPDGSNPDMTLDSSGNLLVGTTTPFVGGVTLSPLGVVQAERNNVSGVFNRTSTDGDILQFRKDGSTVGSIGTLFGDIYLGTGNTGLKFTDSSSLIVPLNTSTLAERDAAVSLGQSSTRFKDLYLSGGVYLGGTGSANKLDDYEEGTFTPSVAVGSVTAASGYYTKIGRQVTIHMKLSQGFNTTNNENQFFQNLPFTSDQHDIAVGSAMMSRADSANRFGTAYMTTNSRIALYSASETGDFDSFRCIDLNSSNAIIYIYASYLAQT
jgi:hypothetical protein